MFKKTPLMHSAQARTPRPAPPGPHPYAKPYDSRLTLSKMDSKGRVEVVLGQIFYWCEAKTH